jgi:hypothetical protein
VQRLSRDLARALTVSAQSPGRNTPAHSKLCCRDGQSETYGIDEAERLNHRSVSAKLMGSGTTARTQAVWSSCSAHWTSSRSVRRAVKRQSTHCLISRRHFGIANPAGRRSTSLRPALRAGGSQSFWLPPQGGTNAYSKTLRLRRPELASRHFQTGFSHSLGPILPTFGDATSRQLFCDTPTVIVAMPARDPEPTLRRRIGRQPEDQAAGRRLRPSAGGANAAAGVVID